VGLQSTAKPTRELRANLCALSLTALTILCARADDWRSYQHDPAHTGYSPSFVNAPALTFAWAAPTGYSTPLIVGDAVFATKNQGGIGSSSTSITSFALANGAVHWTYTGNFVFPSQAAVGGGFVVFGGGIGSGTNQLYVLDANTGALRYVVPGANTTIMPTIVADPVNGSVTAYVGSGSGLTAVSLGPTSGSVLWTRAASLGGSSLPTVVGNSIVMAGPGQYYAFDQQTGAVNHFHSGNVSGGGGVTVAYDATRQQFYVLEAYNTTVGTALTAYHYTSNSQIEMLWQRTGPGIGNGGSVAIGPTGNVYALDNSRIVELSPTSGAILRMIPGSFANAVTPAITGNTIWAFGQSQTFAYDLSTLQLVRTLSGSRGSLNSTYDGPGAFTNGFFALDYGAIVDRPGFNVYVAPVPIQLSRAVSRKSHGSAGAFDVDLASSGSPEIESRSGGPNGDFTVVLSFTTHLASVGMASITTGTGSVMTSGIDPDDSRNYLVHLTGVANVQRITIALTNVSNIQGGTMSQVAVTMGVLQGDANGDASVNADDVIHAKSQSGSGVGNANFTSDVNTNGIVNASDVSAVKANVGTALP
jgi:hypothetical protein